MNLKEAQEKGKIKEFIEENSKLRGDKKKFDKLIKSISCQKPKVHQTSSRGDS